jgi:hypothetical protein
MGQITPITKSGKVGIATKSSSTAIILAFDLQINATSQE